MAAIGCPAPVQAPLQGYFTGPPGAVLAMVADFVEANYPDMLAAFREIAADPWPHSVYDWLADEIGVHLNDVYEWDTAQDGLGLPQAMHFEPAVADPTGAPVVQGPQANVEQPPQVQPEAPSLAVMLQDAFVQAGIPKKFMKNSPVLNFLLDFGSVELADMSIDAKVQNVPSYLRNALAYTSCHRTAERLFARMGTADAKEEGFFGKDKGQASHAGDGAWMGEASTALAQAVTGDVGANRRTIYEIHCGGHGFAVIVRDGRVEVLQSFANYVSLVERLMRGPLVLTAGEMARAAADLASAAEVDRDRVSQLIANCDATVFGLTPHPKYQYRWRRVTLRSDAELIESFTTDIKATYTAIRKMLSDL